MAQIIEDYCSFETSKLLKEKGFDAPCLSYFWTEENGANISYCETPFTNQQLYSGQTLRPTLQMAMKWLMEVHGLFIHIDVIREASCWTADIQDIKNDVAIYPVKEEFSGYEEATESAIKYCLEKLI